MDEETFQIGDQWFYRGNRSSAWLATFREGGGLSDRVPPVCWPFLEEIARLRHDVARAMANHNADLNSARPEERQGSIPPCVPTQDGEGVHEWVSGDNPVVKGIEVCVKCLALRPAQSQPQNDVGGKHG